jgi:hypothetical protein
MKKTTKILIGILARNGAFNKFDVRDIETYESPDSNYTLIFQQLGDPEWPFGTTDVRLLLKDKNQKKIDSIDTSIQDDGANAYSGNIKSEEWRNDSVIIILQASEMEDKEVKIMFK